MNHTEIRIPMPALPQDPSSEVVKCGADDLLSSDALPDTSQILQFVDISARSGREEDSSGSAQGAPDDVVRCGVDDLLPGNRVSDTSRMPQWWDAGSTVPTYENSLGDALAPWSAWLEWQGFGVEDRLPWDGRPEASEPGEHAPRDGDYVLVHYGVDMPRGVPCIFDPLTAFINAVNSVFPHTLSLLLVGVACMTMALSPEQQ